MTDTTIILVALLIVAVIVIVVVVREYRKKVLASLANITTRAQTLDVPLTAKRTGVNIYTGNWKATGKNISVPQYSVELTINWTAADGTNKTATETLLFPNALSRVGAADLKDWITDLLISEARERLGVE